jgi:hypothetical protein
MRQAAINREGDVEMIKKMVAQGLDSNALFKTGMGETGTVFSWALEFGNNPEILIYLIQQGADVKALRFHEGTPLEMLMSPLDKAIETFYYSRSGGVNLDVLKAMLAHGAQVTDLTRALAQDDRAKVLSLVKEKNPNATTAGMLELSPPADPAKKSAVLSLLSP